MFQILRSNLSPSELYRLTPYLRGITLSLLYFQESGDCKGIVARRIQNQRFSKISDASKNLEKQLKAKIKGQKAKVKKYSTLLLPFALLLLPSFRT
jgi:hypothetical protein